LALDEPVAGIDQYDSWAQDKATADGARDAAEPWASLIVLPVVGLLYLMLIAAIWGVALYTTKPVRRRTALLILDLLLLRRDRG